MLPKELYVLCMEQSARLLVCVCLGMSLCDVPVCACLAVCVITYDDVSA